MDFAFSGEENDFRAMVRDWVEAKCPKDVALELESREDHDGSNFPHQLWQDMADAGFFGIGIEEELGGQGGGATIQAIFMEEIARSLAGISWIWGINQFNAKSIQRFASDDLKAELMPRLIAGECKTAIAVTEPGAGTDLLGGMITTATPDGDGFRISGAKVWSTIAHVSDYLLLLATTDKEAEKPSRGKTLFLVDARAEGVTARPIPKLGMRCVGSCEVFLDGVYVPSTHVIGEVNKGWSHIITTLNNERILVAALSTGVLRGVIEEAVKYATERTAFGKPIGQFQVISHWIADMQMRLMQAELMTYKSCWLYDQDLPCHIESSAAKAIASEYATEAADRGIQILGGYGYSAEYQMQRYWRDARLYQIGPITNQMVRNLVAEDLGAAALVLMAETLTLEEQDVQEEFFARGWTDGLPIVPPTPDRVEAMLEVAGATDPDVLIGYVPARGRGVTLEKAATNAVMAGCLPEYFPVVVAALEAMFDPAFNLHTVLTSTGGAALCAVVSGPIAAEIGMNARHNLLGPGNRANATIGRALRLTSMNVLGSKPGESDASSFGHPGKLTFCFAEDPPPAPWLPLHVRLGYSEADTTVTMCPAEGPHQLAQQLTHSAEDVLRSFARSITHPTWFATGKGGHGVLVLGPEHAGFCIAEGWTQDAVCELVYRESRIAPDELLAAGVRLESNSQHDMSPGPDGKLATLESPEALLLVTAGGEGAGWSAWIPSWAPTIHARRASRRVRPAGEPLPDCGPDGCIVSWAS